MWAESYGQAIVALNKAIGEKVCEELACWSTPELMFNAGLSWIALDCLVRFGGPAVVTGGFTTLEEDEKTGGDGSEAVHAPQAPPEGSADLSHSTQAIGKSFRSPAIDPSMQLRHHFPFMLDLVLSEQRPLSGASPLSPRNGVL